MNRKKRILITGAVSLFGKYLVEHLDPLHQLYLATHEKSFYPKNYRVFRLDVTNEKEVTGLMTRIQPDVVIHLAALSNIDYCQKHPREAHLINVGGTKILCNALTGSKTQFIFISSNTVFANQKKVYSEDDLPHPLNIYGQTKYEAEQIVLKTIPLAAVVRSTTMYGWQPPRCRENDLTYYLKQLKKNIQLYLVNDIYFNPVSAITAAETIKKIITSKFTGILHVGGKNQVNRYEFVKTIAKAFEISPLPRLTVVSHTHFADSAPRPQHACLDITHMQQFMLDKLLPLPEELQRLKATLPLQSRSC